MMQRLNFPKLPAVLAVLVLALSAGAASARDYQRRIRFGRGRTTAILKGGIVRGDTDSYLLGAKAGQRMIVHVTSLEKNAVFTVYTPRPLRRVAGADEVTDWTGRLRRTGDYLIEVGGTRGNTSYTLEVTIR